MCEGEIVMVFEHEITVVCKGRFPLSVLREETCFPDRMEDSAIIEASIMGHTPGEFEVQLRAFSTRQRHWDFSVWRAHGLMPLKFHHHAKGR
ncbi:hypothetical protein LCGC14_1550590 [marine sediment metagenome]|uniref:Uncharacterized protein n=1 Tax=marine sediment metagenome TaxID=412755 RepID=A0A0F9IQC7_9ZZZZ